MTFSCDGDAKGLWIYILRHDSVCLCVQHMTFTLASMMSEGGKKEKLNGNLVADHFALQLMIHVCSLEDRYSAQRK